MKRQFFPKHNLLAAPHQLFSFGVVLIVFAIFVAILRVAAPSTFFYVATPLLHVGDTINYQTKKMINSFGNAQKLTAERNTLSVRNTTLLRENIILEARVHELTTLIGTSSPASQGIVADVLSRPPESPYDTLLVDAGSSSKVRVGDVVLARGGIPVGNIVTITSQTALVRLFSSPNATTTSWVGATHVPIVLRGVGGGTFTARVSKGSTVTIGDVVFASSYRARPIGTVVRIDTRPTAVVQTLYIRPFVNIFSLTAVEIVLSTSP